MKSIQIERVTTGSKSLDGILGGGLCVGKVTELFGPFKSGKSSLIHAIAVASQLQIKEEGLKGSVIYIDTEGTFSESKIISNAKRFGLHPKEVLANIDHIRVCSIDDIIQTIQEIEHGYRKSDINLVIIDSLMSLFQKEYVGIGMLSERQSKLNNVLHTFSRIAEKKNCVLLFTNHIPNPSFKTNIVAHKCHYRIRLKTIFTEEDKSLRRKAVIIDSPELPPNDCEFMITDQGLFDLT